MALDILINNAVAAFDPGQTAPRPERGDEADARPASIGDSGRPRNSDPSDCRERRRRAALIEPRPNPFRLDADNSPPIPALRNQTHDRRLRLADVPGCRTTFVRRIPRHSRHPFVTGRASPAKRIIGAGS